MQHMKPIRCLLVDDETLARELLRSVLVDYPLFQVVGEAEDVFAAASAVKRHRPDVIFLDIQMPDGTGFDLLNMLQPDPPAVVFITAFDRYAVRAFDVNAIDYLLKPVEPGRLKATLQRLQTLLGKGDIVEDPAPPLPRLEWSDQVFIKSGLSGWFMGVKDILFITADRNYTHVVAADGRKAMVRETMANWTGRLPERFFAQVDRASLVNIRRVSRTSIRFRSAKVQFADANVTLDLGRSAAARLRAALRQAPCESNL